MTKKYLNKILLLGTLAVPAFVSLSVAAVSCETSLDKEWTKSLTDSEAKKSKQSTNNVLSSNIGLKLNQKITTRGWKSPTDHTIVERTQTYWDSFKYYEGKAVEVYDGDTYLFEGKDPNGQDISFRVRCWGIDTPESTNKLFTVGEIEQHYSDLDTAHAKKLILNKPVRVIITGNSYDRKVGLTFFGNNFEHSYDYQMLKDGFTLPRITESDFINWKREYSKKNKSSPTSLFVADFAKATNYAIINRLGFYQDFKTPIELQNKVYGTHNNIVADFVLLPKYLASGVTLNEDNNVFKFLEAHGDK